MLPPAADSGVAGISRGHWNDGGWTARTLIVAIQRGGEILEPDGCRQVAAREVELRERTLEHRELCVCTGRATGAVKG